MDVDALDHINSACTNAMIFNLVARLVQNSHNDNVNIQDGVYLMFAQDWRACRGFLLYVKQVMLAMQNKKFSQVEVETLDFGPFCYSLEILTKLVQYSAERVKHMLDHGQAPSESEHYFTPQCWDELFSILLDLLVNYFHAQRAQLEKFGNAVPCIRRKTIKD